MAVQDSPRAALEHHLQSILDGDIEAYHASTSTELTLYEWYVTPHRIDGLPFHDFMLAESARPDTPAIAQRIPEGTALDPAGGAGRPVDRTRQRFDLANYHEQVYGDCAICSYTLLVTRGTSDGTSVRSHHETRVLVLRDGQWKVVHVHKSPAWNAPYQPPAH